MFAHLLRGGTRLDHAAGHHQSCHHGWVHLYGRDDGGGYQEDDDGLCQKDHYCQKDDHMMMIIIVRRVMMVIIFGMWLRFSLIVMIEMIFSGWWLLRLTGCVHLLVQVGHQQLRQLVTDVGVASADKDFICQWCLGSIIFANVWLGQYNK